MIKKLLILSLLFFPLSSFAQTNISSPLAGKLTVDMNIMIYGPGSSQSLADSWEKSLMDAWQKGLDENSCYDVELNINVEFSGDTGGITGFDISRIVDELVLVPQLGNEYPSYDAIYVPDVAPGQWYRSWARIGSYDQDEYAVVNPNDPPGTIIHEIGHLLGMEDHYTDKDSGSVPDPGWGNNIMAEDEMSILQSALGGGYSGKMDNRNFEEMFDAFEEETSEDMKGCLAIEVPDLTTDYIGHINTDHFKSNFSFNVAPEFALSSESDNLVGDGTGHGDWSPGQRSDSTVFQEFKVTNNDFPINITGTINDLLYEIKIDPQDKTASIIDGKSNDMGGHLGSYLSYASGFCTVENSSAQNLKIDITKAKTGMTCDFDINRTADFTLLGSFTLKIISRQG